MAQDPSSTVTPYVGHERAEADTAAESEAVTVEAGTHLVLREGNLSLGTGGSEAAEAAERQRVEGPGAVMCPLWQENGAHGTQVAGVAGAEQGASGASSSTNANTGNSNASVNVAGAVKQEKAQREARAQEAAEAKAKKGSWSAVSAANCDSGGDSGGAEGDGGKKSQPFITEDERRALPEFFDGSSVSKTPEVYAHIRAYMLRAQAAMKEPSKPGNYLTLTACRRALAGDAAAVMRVHEYLEATGQINSGIAPHLRPAAARLAHAVTASSAAFSTSDAHLLASSYRVATGEAPGAGIAADAEQDARHNTKPGTDNSDQDVKRESEAAAKDVPWTAAEIAALIDALQPAAGKLEEHAKAMQAAQNGAKPTRGPRPEELVDWKLVAQHVNEASAAASGASSTALNRRRLPLDCLLMMTRLPLCDPAELGAYAGANANADAAEEGDGSDGRRKRQRLDEQDASKHVHVDMADSVQEAAPLEDGVGAVEHRLLSTFVASLRPTVAAAAAAAAFETALAEETAARLDMGLEVNYEGGPDGCGLAQAVEQSLVATAFAGYALNLQVKAARSKASLQRATMAVLEAQLQRAELRLTHFAELQERLQIERAAVARERAQLREARRDLDNARQELERERSEAASEGDTATDTAQ